MRSITWRLTVWYAAILVFILTICGLAAFWSMRYVLYTGAAQEAVAAVQTVQKMAVTREGNSRDNYSHIDPDDPELINAAGNNMILVQITSPDGRVLSSSWALKNAPLSPGYVGPPVLTRFRGREVYLAGGKLAGGALVQVARPLAREEEFLQDLARVFMFLVLAGLLLALAGGWLLTRAALRPVYNMTRTARQISATDLRRRIALRGSRDELYVLGETFNQMLDRLERAFCSQQEFVAAASHDLRTPLTVIKSYAELLNRWGKNEPTVVEESVRAINRAAGLMERLVNDLLLLARVDAGPTLQPVLLDLTELAVETLQEARAVAKNLTVEINPAPPILINADEHYLRRAIWALVDNAIKYNRPGGKVEIRLEAREGKACFSVHDTGTGIEAGDLPRIFERFYRADQARGQGRGFGLGLALARSIVESHGGTITVRSQPGRGSSFTVMLPLAANADGV